MVDVCKVGSHVLEISKDYKILRKHSLLALSGKEPYVKAIETYEELLSLINGDRALIQAFIFAIEKHEGQWYQWKGKNLLPYSYHICKCALNAIHFGAERHQVIIALWHDLIEDKKATAKEIKKELQNKTYSKINAANIIEALLILDKGGISSKKYFTEIATNKDATIAKAADIAANIDECIARFDEMIQGEQRFWIYNYLVEIPIFLSKIKSKDISDYVTSSISGKIKVLLSSIPEKNKIEFETYARGAQ